MSDHTVQDLFVWVEKYRQLSESLVRTSVDVDLLESAASDSENPPGYSSGSQLEFARIEKAKIVSQYDHAWEKVTSIVASLDKAR